MSTAEVNPQPLEKRKPRAIVVDDSAIGRDLESHAALATRADSGCKVSQFEMAEKYMTGSTTTVVNESHALDLYMLAAEQGHEGAVSRLLYIMREKLENITELDDNLMPAFHAASVNNMADGAKIFALLQKCGYQEAQVGATSVSFDDLRI